MRISYIITPFRSSEYLVRCVNSILRQTASDNEIIIAESKLETGGDTENYFLSKNQVKYISGNPQTDFEKIDEAVKMVQESSWVKFLSVDTVAVPIASAEAGKCEGDLFFTAAAVRDGENCRIEKPDGCRMLQNTFIKKELFANFPKEALVEPFLFEVWLDKNIASGAIHGATENICFYLRDEYSAEHNGTAQQYVDEKEDLLFIIEHSLKSGTKTGLVLFDKYLSVLYKLMHSEQCDMRTKEKVFEIVKQAVRFAEKNEAAQRIFLLYFGVDTETAAGMDAGAYIFYSQRVLTLSDKAVVTAQLEQVVEDAVSPIRKSLSALSAVTEIKSKQEEAAKKNMAMAEEIKMLKNDIAALTKNMHFVFNAAASEKKETMADPVQQIPAMFAQGRLGLKVILKSLKAWLRYKLSRKK